MYIFYIDESGAPDYTKDPQKQHKRPLFAIGGVIINEDQWKVIDKAIVDFKKSIVHKDFRLHAIELIRGVNNFKGFEEDDRLSIYEDFFKKIEGFNYKVIFVSINKKGLVDEGRNWSPLKVSCEALNRKYDYFLERQESQGIRVFEKSHKEIILRNIMEEVKEKGTPFRHKMKCIIGEPLFCPSVYSNILQMADMIISTVMRKEVDVLYNYERNYWFSKLYKKYIEKNVEDYYRYPSY